MRDVLRYRNARVVVLWAVAVAAVQGLGLYQAKAGDSTTVIRYLATHGNITAFEIADAKGWLKDKNIRIEQQGYSQGGPESLTALAAGSVDIAEAATSAIINAIAGGTPILAVAPTNGISQDVNSKFFVLADSSIKNGQDLKDKSIAVNTLGAHLDYTVQEYLRKLGLQKDDVQLITVPGPQLDQVLRHKQADVVAVGSWQGVFAGKILAEGGVRILFTDYDVLGNIVLSSVAIKKAFINEHPQAVADLVTAMARASDWTTDHPAEAKTVIAEILKKRGENSDLAQYWLGYGLRRNALYSARDAQFWIDVLVRIGRLKPGQFSPEDVETGKYNTLASRAQK